jgi:HEAT repeat protein
VSDLERRLTAIAGEDEWTRHRTLKQLRDQGVSAAAVEELGECLHDDDATRRAAARMALAALAAPTSASRSDAQRELRRRLRSDDESMRVLAASALGESGDPDSGPALLDALGDPSPNVVAAAADGLGELGYAPALEALGETSRTADFWVRAAAIVAMGRLRDERAVPHLDRLAREPGLEQPIVEALTRIDHPGALPVLERIYRTAPDRALRAAGHVLVTHPEVEAPSWVMAGARADEEALRYAMVEHDDPAVGRLVGLAGSREAIQCLVDLLGPPRRSEAAIPGLLAAPAEPRADALLARLPDADERELLTLLSLLPPLQDRERIRMLVPLLEHADAGVRGAGAEALARAQPEEALPLLAAEVAREGVIPEVIRAVGSLGEVACSSLVPLLGDPAAPVRAAAAAALARCANPGTESALREALGREDDAEARDAILRSLARCAGGAAVPALERALDSDRIDTRLAAIEGLGFTRDESALPPLERALQGTRAETLAAIRALGQLGVPAAAPVIAPFLDHQDLDIRRAAAWEAIVLVEGLESASLERIATDEDPWIRSCAARALARRGGGARQRLRELAERDPDAAVRGEARRGLDGGG